MKGAGRMANLAGKGQGKRLKTQIFNLEEIIAADQLPFFCHLRLKFEVNESFISSLRPIAGA